MPTARPARSPWIATPVVALASMLGIFGLSTMIEYGPWWRTVAGLLVVTMAAVMITRATSRSRLAPTTVGAGVAILIMVPAFTRDADGERRLLPTPGGLVDLWIALQDGVTHAATSAAPVESTRPFVALIAAAVLALFLVSEHLAVTWRASASAGLLLMLPWLPAIILQHRVSIPVLLVVITAWLATLALTRPGAAPAPAPSMGAAVTATAATVAAVLLVAPVAMGGYGWGALPRFDSPGGFDTATRLNLDLDLRTSLTAQSQSVVMSYVTSGSRPDAFRLYTLTEFDGTAWQREDVDVAERPADSGVLWPLAVDGWDDRVRSRVDIQVLSLTERNLPLPTSPRTVTVGGDWYYNAELDEVATDRSSSQGVGYQVVTDPGYLSADALQASQATIDAGQRDVRQPRYLALPAAMDVERVSAVAREVTANATSRHEQALALQQYLRDTSQFTYDVTVSPSGNDSVSTFLDDRAGYCVQFATTMVMMARTLDIPARMAVGFLPGEVRDADTYEVIGADAHTWPELYFPDRGWVRYEPTPAVQTGSPPRWADPRADSVPIPQDLLNGRGGGVSDAPAPFDPNAGAPRPAPADDPADVVPWWVWGAAAALASTAIAALVAWRWRTTRRERRRGPEGAWQELRERLGPEVTWPPTMTPHEAVEHVDERMRQISAGFTESARAALTRLSTAVSDARYAPPQVSREASTATLHAWVDEVATEVAHAQAQSGDARGRPAPDGARSAPRRDA